MKKTSASYDKNKYILLAIILYIVLIFIDILCIKGIIKILNMDGGEIYEKLGIIPLCLVSIILTIGIIGGMIGTIKGWFHKATIKTPNYKNDIYLRELPNNFGIGVTTLLFDSKIENNKDIVAVILDLCARKYLLLTKENYKYIVKILKNADGNLLENEKYIMELLINNNIQNINYFKWYRLCESDGINMGLYTRYKNDVSKNNKTPKDNVIPKMKKIKKISLIIALLIAVINLKNCLVDFSTASLFVGFMESLGIFVTAFIMVFIILFIPTYIFEAIRVLSVSFSNIGNTAVEGGYTNVMSNNLIRTQYGEGEYQKLVSFRNFIKDFGAFADREAKEVVIWDRYLSYAQVFGLTKEIMQTGYKEIVENASFQIDSIDNIELYNIEVLH